MHDLYKSGFFIEERGLYVRHTVWKIIASKLNQINDEIYKFNAKYAKYIKKTMKYPQLFVDIALELCAPISHRDWEKR